jgi:hypothetical protein
VHFPSHLAKSLVIGLSWKEASSSPGSPGGLLWLTPGVTDCYGFDPWFERSHREVGKGQMGKALQTWARREILPCSNLSLPLYAFQWIHLQNTTCKCTFIFYSECAESAVTEALKLFGRTEGRMKCLQRNEAILETKLEFESDIEKWTEFTCVDPSKTAWEQRVNNLMLVGGPRMQPLTRRIQFRVSGCT